MRGCSNVTIGTISIATLRKRFRGHAYPARKQRTASSTRVMVAASPRDDRRPAGILIFCNRAPIIWFSKRQNKVETSTFGSEFQAMKKAVEFVKALRYKRRMFGVPIDGATNLFCDNEAVYKNTTSLPESKL